MCVCKKSIYAYIYVYIYRLLTTILFRYLQLIQETDDFTEMDFPSEMASKFQFLLITTKEATQSSEIEEESRNACYLIRVTN